MMCIDQSKSSSVAKLEKGEASLRLKVSTCSELKEFSCLLSNQVQATYLWHIVVELDRKVCTREFIFLSKIGFFGSPVLC